MAEHIELEPEQEQLLLTLVDAAQRVPRAERDFVVVRTFGGDSILNRGLPGGEASVAFGDVQMLARRGLLLLTSGSGGSPIAHVTPEGIAYARHLRDRDVAVSEGPVLNQPGALTQGSVSNRNDVHEASMEAEVAMAGRNDTCFVIMPFADPINGYYQSIFVPAVSAAGLKAVRADEISRPGSITRQIWTELHRAAVCLAELTHLNPNVMYELGLAHTLHKPVVQVVQNVDELPFDLRHLRHVVYDTRGATWADELRSAITSMLQTTLKDPEDALALPRVAQTQYNQGGAAQPLPDVEPSRSTFFGDLRNKQF